MDTAQVSQWPTAFWMTNYLALKDGNNLSWPYRVEISKMLNYI